MTPETFAIGDVVRLRSGGPAMSVIFVQERGHVPRWEADCVWFTTDGQLCKGGFPFALLVRGPAREAARTP